MSIRFRLSLAVSVLGILGFYFLVNWIVDDLRPWYLATVEESMVETATVLSSLVTRQMSTSDPHLDLLRETFQDAKQRKFPAQIYELTKSDINIRVYVTDNEGMCIYDSNQGKEEGKDYSRWNDVIRTLRGEYGARSSAMNPEDPASSTLFVASPIMFEGEIAGVLTICKPSDSIKTFLDTAKHKVVTVGLLVCLVVVFTGFLSTFWITRPLQKLTCYANKIRDGHKPDPPELGCNEIGNLGKAFDEMRDSLEGKQYIENYIQTLTHEMKSPLAAIRGAAELLDEEMPLDHRRKFLGNIRSETHRLEDLVQRLLELASLEKRKDLQNIEEIDIQELLTEILTSMSSLVAEKQIHIQLDSNHLVVPAERFLLRQAVANLIRNALDFSPVNGSVSISAKKDDGFATITVKDSGPGIPEYALNKVFDRFFSLERPDTRKKSTGLGLTFVQEVAVLHKGSVSVANGENSGAVSTLRLPLI